MQRVREKPGTFSAYDMGTALGFSALCYKKPHIIDKVLREQGYDYELIRHGRTILGIIATKGDEMMLAWRGVDWNSESEFARASESERGDFPGRGIAGEGRHGKILKSFKDIAITPDEETHVSPVEQADKAIARFINDRPMGRINITGHSRGGAMAQIMTGYVLHDNSAVASHIDGIYTFGQPRVGNGPFVTFLKEHIPGKYHRINHALDTASYYPPHPATVRLMNYIDKKRGKEGYVGKAREDEEHIGPHYTLDFDGSITQHDSTFSALLHDGVSFLGRRKVNEEVLAVNIRKEVDDNGRHHVSARKPLLAYHWIGGYMVSAAKNAEVASNPFFNAVMAELNLDKEFTNGNGEAKRSGAMVR